MQFELVSFSKIMEHALCILFWLCYERVLHELVIIQISHSLKSPSLWTFLSPAPGVIWCVVLYQDPRKLKKRDSYIRTIINSNLQTPRRCVVGSGRMYYVQYQHIEDRDRMKAHSTPKRSPQQIHSNPRHATLPQRRGRLTVSWPLMIDNQKEYRRKN